MGCVVAGEHTVDEVAVVCVGGSGAATSSSRSDHDLRCQRRANRWQLPIYYVREEHHVRLGTTQWPGHDSLFREGAPLWLSSYAFKSRHGKAAGRRQVAKRIEPSFKVRPRCVRGSSVSRICRSRFLGLVVDSWSVSRVPGSQYKERTRYNSLYSIEVELFFSAIAKTTRRKEVAVIPFGLSSLHA
jgi:hypothetical protein